MVRLIVQSGEGTRRFKLGEGKLTLGSGERATLTVESDVLEEVHAVIEVTEEEVRLTARPGSTPPVLRGRKLSGSVLMTPGVAITIGDVKIALEREKEAAAAPGASRAKGSKGSKKGARRSRAQGVEAKRRTIKKSLPTWAIIAIILGVVGIGLFFLQGAAQYMGLEGFSEKASKLRIEEALDAREHGTARLEFERVERNWDGLSQKWKDTFGGLRTRVEELDREVKDAKLIRDGNDVLEKRIKGFIDKKLKNPSRPAARVLIKRIQDFREKFPGHPELEWCDRTEARWRPVAQLEQPSNWADIDFEVTILLAGKPTNYKQVFALMNEFIGRATSPDLESAEARLAELKKARQTYFDDSLSRAQTMRMNGELHNSIEWMVQLVIKIGDGEMSNRAAEELIKIPGVEAPMAGYKKSRPDTFAEMMKNPILKGFAAEKGLQE